MDEIEHYYKTLNLKPGASLEEVKQAYRHKAFLWHPDRYPQDSPQQAEAEEKFIEVRQAYEELKSYLSDPQPRRPAKPASPPVPGRSNPVYGKTRPKPPSPAVTAPQTSTEGIPWGWLTGTLISYSLTGWILAELSVPPWAWTFAALAWLAVAISASDGSESSGPWFMALVFAGAVAGWIVGNEAGGWITAIIWAVVGAALGAIAGSEAETGIAIVVLTLAGVFSIAGLVAGTETGNWVGSLLGSVAGSITGLAFGVISDAVFKSRAKIGAGSVFGLGLGAWIGAWTGSGTNAVIRGIEKTGPELIIGAWGAIAVVSGVIAQMVAGEKLLASYNGFYTFVILATISGFGLGLGWFFAH